MALMQTEDESSISSIVRPRWATERNPLRPSYGPNVAAASEAMGRPLMPHQRLVVDVFLEVQSEEAGDPDPGEWAYTDGTSTMPRRGGKTAIQAPLVTHRARLIRGAQMFMTAHKGDVARRRWLDITDDLLRSPLRNDVVRKVSISHEELRWRDGGAMLRPFAPGSDDTHSETLDLILIDEQWAYSAEQARKMKAGYKPTFATTGGQALKQSTAGTDKSDWLNEDVRLGRAAVQAGRQLGRCYFEWSLPDRVGGVLIADLDDEALIQACIDYHPAVCHTPGCPGPRRRSPCPHGFTVRPAVIRADKEDMDRDEFIRAYGNRAAADLSALWTALDESVWNDQTDPGGIPETAPARFGVWVDEDGLDAAVSSAWRDDLGRMHVEPVRRADGIRWVRQWFVEKDSRRTTPVAVGNVGAARDVADELETAGVPVLRVSQADIAAAVSRHRQELAAGMWWHRVNTEATASAAAVGLRKSGGGQVWTRLGDSVAFVGSQTLAGWAFDHAPEIKLGKFGMG